MKMMVHSYSHLASLEGFGERYPYQIYAGASYSAATNSMLILHN
jgi:hypothetical protein